MATLGTTELNEDTRDNRFIEVSIVMPCLNEEETVGVCVDKALDALRAFDLSGEVVVVDNGSSDDSVRIAREHGARVVHQPLRGYGNAYLKGFEEAAGRYVIMADSDNTYDFMEIDRFVESLRAGNELVVGSRFKGQILPGAMTWSHRYIGNPVLSGILNLFFRTPVSDAHCGMRGFARASYPRMRLRTAGMEFASEMVINAAKFGLKIDEVPITYYPRGGTSKLRTMRDGWRHLRYLLLRSPTYLFMAPGVALLLLGLGALVPFLAGPVQIGGHAYDIHAMFLFGVCTLVGYQIVTLGLYARILAVREHLDKEDELLAFVRRKFHLEWGLIAALLLLALSVAASAPVFVKWVSSDLGALTLFDTRLAFFSAVGFVLGIQTLFTSFYLAALLGFHSDANMVDL